MGGETLGLRTAFDVVEGPSPRGRGNRLYGVRRVRRERSIPAWAGKPTVIAGQLMRDQVHPRVGGETRVGNKIDNRKKGPSPRGRGNQARRHPRGALAGSIPAWAGKPDRADVVSDCHGVHPRVGGETLPDWTSIWMSSGPSPRGRGNHGPRPLVLSSVGSIPAWAGKPATGCRRPQRLRVHPRVGGETTVANFTGAGTSGPSPRGRGNRADCDGRCGRAGSIPAWAGKPRSRPSQAPSLRVHPRVGGETTCRRRRRSSTSGPSPRGRGNHQTGRAKNAAIGSIPAWAGKPSSALPLTGYTQVHPRVGGETPRSLRAKASRRGPSPRGRGNRRR